MWFRFAIHKNAVFFSCTLALSVAATVANKKIRYDAKSPHLAIFGTHVICVFYSIGKLSLRTLIRVQICQGFSHFSGFLQLFVLVKLAISNIKVNGKGNQYQRKYQCLTLSHWQHFTCIELDLNSDRGVRQ